jgi:protein pelota
LKIVHKDLKQGVIKVVPEDTDDLWLLHTIIQPGDYVKARTFREIHFGERGSGRSSRIPMVLKIRVESTEFQPFTTRLRIRGIVVEGPEKYGVLGKYHTINLDPGTEVEITKPNGWPHALLKRLEEATKGPSAVIIAIDYDDYAVALIRGQGIKIVAEGSLHLPGKDDPHREEKLREALVGVAKIVEELVQRETPLVIVVTGPGSVKEQLADLIRARLGGKAPRIITDSASMGGVAGVYEEVRRGIMRDVLKEAASIYAEEFLERFEKMLSKEPQRVAYTLDDVLRVVEMGAVEEILVLDELVRHPDPNIRNIVDRVLREADRTRAKINFISVETPAGLKVKALGGIVAILRYSIS